MNEQVRDLANSIALSADAIAHDDVANPHAAALLLQGNIEALVAWTAP